MADDADVLQRITRIETLFEGTGKDIGRLQETLDKIETGMITLNKRVHNVEIWKAKVVGAAAGFGALSGLLAAIVFMALGLG